MLSEKNAFLMQRIVLGLLVLVSGLMKLFVVKPANVAVFLGSLGFPAANFFAWLLLLSEIIFGAAILANYKLKYTVIPPIIIMIVAAFTTALGMDKIPLFIMHIAVAAGYGYLGARARDKE